MLNYLVLIIALVAPVIYYIYLQGPPRRRQPQSSLSSMADSVQQQAQAASSQVPVKGPDGKELTEEEKKKQTWSEYGKEVYNEQYERWMPWVEDMYLRWFTKDNKASYATKDTLDKSKVTGIKQVDTLQDGAHGLVAGQLGQDGLLAPVGNAFSKEGINRAERQGKGEDGSYVGGPAGTVVNPIAEGGQAVGTGVLNAGKSAGSAVGGLFGGSKK